MFISLQWIRKNYGLTVDWSSSARILLSSGVAGILTFILVSELSFSNWMRLLLGIAFFLVVFVVAALLTRAVDRADIDRLHEMVGGLGSVGWLLHELLDLIERLMMVFRLW